MCPRQAEKGPTCPRPSSADAGSSSTCCNGRHSWGTTPAEMGRSLIGSKPISGWGCVLNDLYTRPAGRNRHRPLVRSSDGYLRPRRQVVRESSSWRPPQATSRHTRLISKSTYLATLLWSSSVPASTSTIADVAKRARRVDSVQGKEVVPPRAGENVRWESSCPWSTFELAAFPRHSQKGGLTCGQTRGGGSHPGSVHKPVDN
jgi:hypothetical protein